MVAAALVALIGTWAHAQLAGSPPLHSVSYRGYLEDANGPIDGTVDLELELYDAAIGGTAIGGGPVTLLDHPISAGYFSVELELQPDALRYSQVWIEVRVGPQKAVVGRQQLKSVPYAANVNPPGTIVAFGGIDAPSGWMICDGRALKSTDYPALFTAIGTRWGNGLSGTGAGGGTNFNAPDLRGRFLRGADLSTARDPGPRVAVLNSSASSVGSFQVEGTKMPAAAFATASAGAHTHDYWDNQGNNACGTPSNTDCSGGAESGNRSDVQRTSFSTGSHTHTITGGDNETRPINGAVLYIIKF
jgi:microcystin-dependent protein